MRQVESLGEVFFKLKHLFQIISKNNSMELGSDQRQLHLTSSSNSSNSNISFFSTNQHQELFRHLIKAENIVSFQTGWKFKVQICRNKILVGVRKGPLLN